MEGNMDGITVGVQEGSFEERWEEFATQHNIVDDEVSAKLKYIYFSGAMDFNDVIQQNSSSDVHKTVAHYEALKAEVSEFFEDADAEDITVLSVKEALEGNNGQEDSDSKQG
jgi:4-hydroxy-3-methylbut-2-en-1-yl diphosphate synthase IspG/GcpE